MKIYKEKRERVFALRYENTTEGNEAALDFLRGSKVAAYIAVASRSYGDMERLHVIKGNVTVLPDFGGYLVRYSSRKEADVMTALYFEQHYELDPDFKEQV